MYVYVYIYMYMYMRILFQHTILRQIQRMNTYLHTYIHVVEWPRNGRIKEATLSRLVFDEYSTYIHTYTHTHIHTYTHIGCRMAEKWAHKRGNALKIGIRQNDAHSPRCLFWESEYSHVKILGIYIYIYIYICLYT